MLGVPIRKKRGEKEERGKGEQGERGEKQTKEESEGQNNGNYGNYGNYGNTNEDPKTFVKNFEVDDFGQAINKLIESHKNGEIDGNLEPYIQAIGDIHDADTSFVREQVEKGVE